MSKNHITIEDTRRRNPFDAIPAEWSDLARKAALFDELFPALQQAKRGLQKARGLLLDYEADEYDCNDRILRRISAALAKAKGGRP